ncbi:MAG: hypothetical protein PGN09_09865 [Sphingomonas fennica]
MDDFDKRITWLESGVPAWPVADSIRAADGLARAARAAGRLPAADVAAAFRDALLLEGRGVMLATWIWSLREALAHRGDDRRVGPILVAAVGVRYAA